MIGRVVNLRYEVLERLGEGTFFQVYKARDRVMNRIVAIKSLQPIYARDRDFCTALRRSFGELLNLSHPNIARLYEVGEEDDAPFLVTEFVRGINLKDRIRRIAPFSLSVAVDFAIAIAEALQHAHAEGFIHGDLRPHNIIISPEGALKVTDYGMAQVLSVSQEAAGANLGRAVAYQAPEIASGRSPTVASDIYALGVILYEMLTGSLPFSGETPLVTAMKHQNDPVPSPRTLNPGVPRSLEGITMKALQKRPEDRYRTLADMLSDLKSVRDALRFGKSLSWSPMEGDAAVSLPPPVTPPVAPRDAAARTPEPIGVPEVGAARMSATRVMDDTISPFLKIALGTVIVIIITAVIAGIALWMATFTKPPEQKFPNLVGMKIEEARQAANKANVILMVHEEFNEQTAPGVIYKTDEVAGRPIRPGRSVNVWVSKGSRMVWVPDVRNLVKEEADTKLKEAGLILGDVSRAFDNRVPYDFVVSQNPRPGKRVKRGEAVSLVISDGPKEPPPLDNPAVAPGSDTGSIAPPSGGIGEEGSGFYDDTRPRSFNLRVAIKRDGRGERRVRVEYDDAQGTHIPIDEMHNEGDVVAQKVEVYGRQITVRVYYDDELRSEQVIDLSRGR